MDGLGLSFTFPLIGRSQFELNVSCLLFQISAQVREELRVMFYGNQLMTGVEAPGDPAGPPGSLLQWLSERYVSDGELRASLASLELRVLQNISQQLKELEELGSLPTSSSTETSGDAGATVTEEVQGRKG